MQCAAVSCKSNVNTLINGKEVYFFNFPDDPILHSEWNNICKKTEKLKGPRHQKVLCHLHFTKDSFESIDKLKPDAVPMVHFRKRHLEMEQQVNGDKTKRACDSPSPVNNETTMDHEMTQSDNPDETKVQPYRLTIQIEKILHRPCPKSKKNNQKKKSTTRKNILLKQSSNAKRTIVKDENQQLPLCLVCKMTFGSTTELHSHLKDHFTCDICRLEFLSQKSQRNHYEIHQSKNERYPYKCHVCNALFEKKDYIKTHNHIKNIKKFETTDDNRIQYCKSCCLTFRDEPTFRKHLNSHVESAALNHFNDLLKV